MEENQHMSIRNISRNLRETQENIANTSYGKIQKTLKTNCFKPYKIRPTTKLTPRQRADRATFCQLMLQRINIDNNLLRKVLWTDESTFMTTGMINRQNTRHWAVQNPHSYRVSISGPQIR